MRIGLSLMLVLAFIMLMPSGAAIGATPSMDEMWRIIQAQQAQIDRLEKALGQSGASSAGDSSVLAERVDQTERQIAATADAVERIMTDGAPGGAGVDIGGYGELHYNDLDNGEEIDFHRFVLFFGHRFREDLRFFSEFELEHSIAGEGKVGEIELEQAFVQWDYAANQNAKFGLFLVPVGILNETHEPDTFYGVERNAVEKNILPATWWEGGAALSGEIAPGWRYDVAMHSGLNLDADNSKASSRSSIRSARQKVGEANADSLAYTARIRYSGIPGLQLGMSLQRQTDLTQGDDDGVGVSGVDATLFETDLTLARGNFGFRALYARWDINSRVNALNPGSDEQVGWYVEPSFRVSPDLGLFARYSQYDLTAGSAATSDERSQWDFGVNYWLHDNVVMKLDYQRQDNERAGEVDGFNVGLGYSF